MLLDMSCSEFKSFLVLNIQEGKHNISHLHIRTAAFWWLPLMQTIHSNSSWVGFLTFSYLQNFTNFTPPLEGDDNHSHPLVDNLIVTISIRKQSIRKHSSLNWLVISWNLILSNGHAVILGKGPLNILVGEPVSVKEALHILEGHYQHRILKHTINHHQNLSFSSLGSSSRVSL